MEKFSKKGSPYQLFLEPTAGVTITFSCRLRLSDSEPDELLMGIRRIGLVNADKNVSKTRGRKSQNGWQMKQLKSHLKDEKQEITKATRMNID